ncbi:hypothetical protein IEQ34_012044 [Dendrobium chrysotoxum]|uniref:Uncharacterized protein n=1 Tax=Dendrobium chrysotoxum TaxID=161865 RepID=A0AAV7GVF3_DENCH|nr:hypothetical protein IEQ34_012044 [Dendrobium chrysotoxum]
MQPDDHFSGGADRAGRIETKTIRLLGLITSGSRGTAAWMELARFTGISSPRAHVFHCCFTSELQTPLCSVSFLLQFVLQAAPDSLSLYNSTFRSNPARPALHSLVRRSLSPKQLTIYLIRSQVSPPNLTPEHWDKLLVHLLHLPELFLSYSRLQHPSLLIQPPSSFSHVKGSLSDQSSPVKSQLPTSQPPTQAQYSPDLNARPNRAFPPNFIPKPISSRSAQVLSNLDPAEMAEFPEEPSRILVARSYVTGLAITRGWGKAGIQ